MMGLSVFPPGPRRSRRTLPARREIYKSELWQLYDLRSNQSNQIKNNISILIWFNLIAGQEEALSAGERGRRRGTGTITCTCMITITITITITIISTITITSEAASI